MLFSVLILVIGVTVATFHLHVRNLDASLELTRNGVMILVDENEMKTKFLGLDNLAIHYIQKHCTFVMTSKTQNEELGYFFCNDKFSPNDFPGNEPFRTSATSGTWFRQAGVLHVTFSTLVDILPAIVTYDKKYYYLVDANENRNQIYPWVSMQYMAHNETMLLGKVALDHEEICEWELSTWETLGNDTSIVPFQEVSMGPTIHEHPENKLFLMKHLLNGKLKLISF